MDIIEIKKYILENTELTSDDICKKKDINSAILKDIYKEMKIE